MSSISLAHTFTMPALDRVVLNALLNLFRIVLIDPRQCAVNQPHCPITNRLADKNTRGTVRNLLLNQTELRDRLANALRSIA